MNERLLEFIESSFLKDLLSDSEITDISYNGESVFYQSNLNGRNKYEVEIKKELVQDFLRQIANLSEKQFSYTSPILDISIGRYRINAVHSAIARCNDDKSISFSIRVASKQLKISNNGEFLSKEANDFLLKVLENKISIAISGKTSSGKTEFQKFLISQINKNEKIIVLDNVNELDSLHLIKNLDVTEWQINEFINKADFESLIANALRNNPDWIIVAEARGKEMSSVITSASTGHPLIMTLHSKDIYSIPDRMIRMAMLKDKSNSYEEINEEIKTYFPIYIYLKRKDLPTGEISRYVEAIGEYDGNKVTIIYSKEKGLEIDKISKKLRKELNL